jgi:translation initiation factor 3 subunit C
MILSANDIVISEKINEENEVVDRTPYRIHGYIITVVERLDEEFTKLLKECDPHSNEYVQRLKDETRVVEIIDKIQAFLEKSGEPAELCSVYMRKIEHLYYKFDPMVLKQKNVSLKYSNLYFNQI